MNIKEIFTEDTKAGFSYILQYEYLRILDDSDHLPDPERPFYEITFVNRINELSWFLKNRSINWVIAQSKLAKTIRRDVPLPADRYSFYDFADPNFSEVRFNNLKSIERLSLILTRLDTPQFDEQKNYPDYHEHIESLFKEMLPKIVENSNKLPTNHKERLAIVDLINKIYENKDKFFR
jgi:hypothetical protein